MGTWKSGARVILLAALGSAGGCGQEDGATPGEVDPLRGRTFLLQSSEGFQALPGTTVRLGFSDDDASFNAGCNSYSGPYQLKNGVLSVARFGSTEIGCDAPLHQQDDWIATFIEGGPRLTLRGNDLTLDGAGAKLVFLDRIVADPDRPLVGTPWTVDTYFSGGAASTFLVSKEPRFTLGIDGRVQIETACNTGTGAFVNAGAKLTLKNVAYTSNPCAGNERQADQQLQAVLADGELSVKIVADRLTLMRGELGVGARTP